MDETRKQLLLAMGFSEKAIFILDQNLNMCVMDNPSVTVQHQGKCGDILILSLKISNGTINDAAYEYIGCAGLQACASAMTEMVKGEKVEKARNLDTEDILQYLQGIPPQKFECAEIARDTLRLVLDKVPEQ